MKWISVNEWIAKHFGAGAPTPTSVRRWCNQGRFGEQARRVGGRWYIRSNAEPGALQHTTLTPEITVQDTGNKAANAFVLAALQHAA